MSQFYAEIKSNGGEVTRTGSKASGIQSHTRGWNVGVKVLGYIDDDGKDVFDVYRTNGSSHGIMSDVLLTTIKGEG